MFADVLYRPLSFLGKGGDEAWVECHGVINVDRHRLQVKVYYNKITVKIHTQFPPFFRIQYFIARGPTP